MGCMPDGPSMSEWGNLGEDADRRRGDRVSPRRRVFRCQEEQQERRLGSTEQLSHAENTQQSPEMDFTCRARASGARLVCRIVFLMMRHQRDSEDSGRSS